MSGESRIERIEDAVIKLEKDMAVMTSSITNLTNSVSELSTSMKDLVKLNKDQELLKQEIDYAKSMFRSSLDESKKDRVEIWKYVSETKQKCLELEKEIMSNSFFTRNATKLGWLFVAAAVSAMFYVLKTAGV